MFLRLMDCAGGSRTIEVADCSFHRLPEPHIVYRVTHEGDPVKILLLANAYLMNGKGNTIDKFSPR